MRYHLIGIGGSSMSGIARLLRAEGNTVTGTDAATTGNGPHLLPQEVDVVVYSDAVTPGTEGFEELSAARARNVKTLRRIDFIAERMNGKTSIAIAGAHGKSTTTAQIGWSLTECSADPTVFIGADLKEFGGSARAGSGSYVVTEACEWNKQFLELHPTVLVLTTIDREHLDTYPGGIFDVMKSFRKIAEQVDPKGFIVANGDDEHIRKVLLGIDRKVVWFGKSEDAQYQLLETEVVDGKLRIGIELPSSAFAYLTSQLVGLHHATNATAAFVVLNELGFDQRMVLRSVTSFPGLQRRFERYRDNTDLTVIDDYAHHPTEISATIAAAKAWYPGRRIIAVFQPHLSQRTTDLFEEFSHSFSLADVVFIADTYEPAGRVIEANAKTSAHLVSILNQQSIQAFEGGEIDETFTNVKKQLKPGDVVITMGATAIWKVAEALKGN